jgi:hypothetical protein
MKKPSHSGRTPSAKQPLRPIDDRALEHVRGGNRAATPVSTASDDWLAPVV